MQLTEVLGALLREQRRMARLVGLLDQPLEGLGPQQAADVLGSRDRSRLGGRRHLLGCCRAHGSSS